MTDTSAAARRAKFAPVLERERREIFPPDDPAIKDTTLAALCLSGGGIRSATFALGVLQGLARFGLLGEFHYLSTVSGGGYIGSWLTAWRKHARDDAAVFKALDRFSGPDGDEAAEIAGLRANSNYLTPKLGLFSADTWAALALVVRNIVLNWLVFGPLFLGVLCIPKLLASLLASIATAPALSGLWRPSLAAAVLLTGFGLHAAVRGRLTAEKPWLTDARFLLFVLIPLVLAAMALTGVADARLAVDPWRCLIVGAIAGAVTYAVAWGAGCGLVVATGAYRRSQVVGWSDCLTFVIGGAVAGVMLAMGAYAVTAWSHDPQLMVVFGLSWVMLAFAIADLVFVGLNSFAHRGDQDREWLARFSGWILAAGVTWAVGSAVVFYMPWLIRWEWVHLSAYLGSLGVSGVVTLALGASGSTGATTAQKARENFGQSTLVSLAAIVFAICLAGGLSAVDDAVLRAAGCQWPPQGGARDVLIELAGVVVPVVAALAISYFVNVNRFSLHALYRNRLTRAYLGTARLAAVRPRHPDPFSNFDPNDNLSLKDLLPACVAGKGRRLLHVVNMTLNTVSTKNLAWQERKAESFTASCLHTGNAIVGYQPTAFYGGTPDGLSLATAMAISGAAVSPNMGYHSSPLVGMLLSLFNLRLGAWLGNPAKASYGSDGPVPGLFPALLELTGHTTDDATWIYLSDGGHFDNLGLYEMVQRGCRTVVVIDAGCDPACAFEDLGNAVRKIYIDFGISINFTSMAIAPRQTPPVDGFYCAQGQIFYPNDAEPGWLLYIKPGYHGVEPPDVRSYAVANASFPHEATADQWFSESQFEAYRALGAYITEAICTGGQGLPPNQPAPVLTLADLRTQAMVYLGRKTPQQASKTGQGAALDPLKGDP